MLIGGAPQQKLQRRKLPVAFGQKIIYLRSGHLAVSRSLVGKDSAFLRRRILVRASMKPEPELE